ncbi:MAG: phage antirepressor KilAC domain-containing protein [Prevotellaceae bacterium]|nr:phage antirepressor KilAC domain-containing protein [Prevotellaceae bacterium]
MEADIQIFSNDLFGEVRIIEKNGQVMFVANDVAKSLGYKEPQHAIATHCKSGDVLNWNTAYIPHSNGVGGTNVIIIGESNVYRLIMHSHLPDAEKFQDWIFDEVLPSIRKTGGYILSGADDTPELIMARALQVAQETINRHKQRVQMLEGQNELLTDEVRTLAPKAAYTDTVLMADSTYTMTQVAKELDMSAIALERWLREHGIIFRQSGQYFLYARYQVGYTKSRTHHFARSDGSIGTKTFTVWTEAGRRFVHKLLTEKRGGPA